MPPIEHLRRFGCRVYKHIPPAQRKEKKFGSRSNPSMMLGYVHNTTKIWRIWDFNSGKTGRAVECSSVVFDEKEDAFTCPTGERSKVIEFPEDPQESHEVEEMNIERMDDSLGIQDNSKLITQKKTYFVSLRHKHLELQSERRGSRSCK
jgi:hypothetical protein